jgi:phosphoribosylaminoimidazolecarboxamide formyltransferase / IMP cyclohydrolase
MIDELLNFNKTFVETKGYEKYITNKYPDKKIAIVTCMDTRLAGNKADIWYLRQHPKVLNLPWVEKIRRADRDNTIDIYISEDHDDVLADGVWQQFFTEKPEVLTREEKRAWLDTLKGVSLGSDAFFPFGDNIERAHKSGVEYIAQAGGSVRDDHVIETCDKYGIAMAFTGIRLFHH